jgi:8-oxo-dGTP pyrophosphatase MutT (NUDIX family)
MDGLNLLATEAVLEVLRQRLVSIEQAHDLIDQVEGLQPGARQAAVLLPLFVQDGRLHLAFIRRAQTLLAHRGEIAFPGGKVEPDDASYVATAIREAQEEIGLQPGSVRVLGVLHPVFTVTSNYLITPVVGFLPSGLGTLHLQESEVAELIIASLSDLADPAIARTEQWTRQGQSRTIYFYDYATCCIWGATGRILAALLALLH